MINMLTIFLSHISGNDNKYEYLKYMKIQIQNLLLNHPKKYEDNKDKLIYLKTNIDNIIQLYK